ncbi:MAG: transcriptional regulator GutM [Eubacteriales bacterium]|jgi:glucitol operon activator protein
MTHIVLVLAIAFGLQLLLSTLQMKNFNKNYIEMRRKGKVAIGRKSGGFYAGAIVMFRIDNKGIIQEGRKIEGTTCFARVRSFPGYEGRNVAELTEADGPKHHRNLCKAIADAALTYRKFVNGETISDTPSPLRRAGSFLHRSVSK